MMIDAPSRVVVPPCVPLVRTVHREVVRSGGRGPRDTEEGPARDQIHAGGSTPLRTDFGLCCGLELLRFV